MSDTVKKLMEGLKSTTRTPAPSLLQTKPSATTSPSITPPPSAIDQQIAKLSIPEVAPVESIKQRLQLLEVQAGQGQGSPTAKTSSGKNRYLAMVEDRIDGQWIAPPLMASNPLVVLTFHIARSGEISRIQIAESSGHAYYDSAAQRAVQAVNPLPPFPSDISDSFFDVQYRFIKD
jgi:TonB family protein